MKTMLVRTGWREDNYGELRETMERGVRTEVHGELNMQKWGGDWANRLEKAGTPGLGKRDRNYQVHVRT
jgi:hypothetical protein